MTTTPTATSGAILADDQRMLDKQVADWCKEVARLQDLISHAIGPTGGAQIDSFTADELDEIEVVALAAPSTWYGTYQIADGISDEKAVALIEACSPDTLTTLVGMARAALAHARQQAGDDPHADDETAGPTELHLAQITIADLRAQLASAQQNAARYLWLRDKSEPGICAFYLSVGQAFHGVKFAPETVDEAIDAQIVNTTGN